MHTTHMKFSVLFLRYKNRIYYAIRKRDFITRGRFV